MNIPDKIKVGGHWLDVIVTNDPAVIEHNQIGRTVLGKNTIWINSDYPQSRQEEALLHEVLHNCFFDIEEEQDEAMIERLGKIMYQVIVDNSSIFADQKQKSIKVVN